MPYDSTSELPAHVQGLSQEKRRQWIAVFNSVYEKTGDDGQAMIAANGAVKSRVIKCVGDVVKSIDDETFGGYGVVFTSPLRPDLTDEFFDSSTFYWPDVPTSIVLYDHTFGVHPKGIEIDKENKQIKVHQLEPYKYRIGHVTKRAQDERGIYIEFKLDPTIAAYNEQLNVWEELVDEEHQQWLDRIRKRLQKGELNFSSDSMDHLVEREYIPEHQVYHIKSWPLPLISITPKAAEPEALINQVKALSDEVLSNNRVPEARLTRVAQDAPPNETKQEENEAMLTVDERFQEARHAVTKKWDSLRDVDFVKVLAAFKAEGDDTEEDQPIVEEETNMKGDFAAQLQPIAESLAALYGGTTEEWLAAVMQVGAALQMEVVAPVEELPAEGGVMTEETMSVDRKAVRKALGNMGGYKTVNYLRTGRAPSEPSLTQYVRAVINRDFAYLKRVSGEIKREYKSTGVYIAEPDPLSFYVPMSHANRILARIGNPYAIKAQGINPDSAGGFLTRPDQAPDVVPVLRPTSVMMDLCSVIPLNTDTMDVPKQTGGASSSFVGENVQITEEENTFGNLKLVAKKQATRVIMSNEILADSSPAMDTFITEDITRAMGQKFDETVLRGSGTASIPLGILNIPNVTKTALTTGMTYNDLVTVVERVEVENVSTANPWTWVLHPTAKRIIRTIQDDAGQYIWTGSDGVGQQLGGSLPTQLVDYPWAQTTTGGLDANSRPRIFFGNWKDVVIGMRQTLEIKTSDQAGTLFENDQFSIRAIMRWDLVLRYDESIEVITAVQ